jgi:hypothetical protein
MKIERVRSILGVWAPMAIGLFIIVTSINFYLTAKLEGGFLVGELESWRLACSAGVFFVGGVLILSTYGRYTKTREARLEASAPKPSGPPVVAAPGQAPEDEREHHANDRESDNRG